MNNNTNNTSNVVNYWLKKINEVNTGDKLNNFLYIPSIRRWSVDVYDNQNKCRIFYYATSKNKMFLLVVLDEALHKIKYNYCSAGQNIELKTAIFNLVLFDKLRSIVKNRRAMKIDTLLPLISLCDSVTAFVSTTEEGIKTIDFANVVTLACIQQHIAVMHRITTTDDEENNSKDNSKDEGGDKIILFDSKGSANYKKLSECVTVGNKKCDLENLNNVVIQATNSCYLIGLSCLRLLANNREGDKYKYIRDNFTQLFTNNNPIGDLLIIEEVFYILNREQKLLTIDFDGSDNVFIISNCIQLNKNTKVKPQYGKNMQICNLIDVNNVNLLIQNQLSIQEKQLNKPAPALESTPKENKHFTLLGSCCGNDSDKSRDDFDIEGEEHQPQVQQNKQIQNDLHQMQQDQNSQIQIDHQQEEKRKKEKKEQQSKQGQYQIE